MQASDGGLGKLSKRHLISWLFILLLPLLACETATEFVDGLAEDGAPADVAGSEEDETFREAASNGPEMVEIAPPEAPSEGTRPTSSPILSKWDLWSSGETLLRGANIWQALVIPELDGPTFKGSGHVGPPYSQEDFDRLAAFGANYVTISGPGLFTETPPYEVDLGVQAHMDDLLEMIARADLFATISFRTGPGRSEYSLCCGGESYYDGYFNDTVWQERPAQDGWVEMWRYTAERYRDNPVVVGYKLMVEPNAEAIFFDSYEPDEFYPDRASTSYDWNQFYPRIVEGIREVDTETPILVGGMGFSAIRWLPYLQPVDDPHVVYVVHQYHPYEEYTHQPPEGRNTYPDSIDLDYDNSPDEFDYSWLEGLLTPIDQFSAANGAPTAVDEFGVNRWVPGGAAYMDDLMDLLEQRGINHSLWEWQTSWPEFRLDVHDMDYRLGPDPSSRSETENDLLDVIVGYWRRNSVRPSTVPWASTN